MDLPAPLVTGRLLRRYKRFLCDVALDEGRAEVTAHCPNPGRMLGLDTPGARVWLSVHGGGKRKLAHALELVEAEGTLVGINTQHPNRIAAEAILAGRIPALAGYAALRREVAYGTGSRIDLLLTDPGRPPCYVEVKNVHLRRGARAEFPDSVTARGTKHLGELARVVAAGGRAVMHYVVQRADCDAFALAADIDPAYAAAFDRATAGGVEALCYSCNVTPPCIAIDRALPILAGSRR
ncbi:MAG: DNA/RNA nuclease SfsA [Alphaproteobacteria bacterium]|nr:DNA/RNA nuclease SfsA [Alphaproteobacteria bacterium]